MDRDGRNEAIVLSYNQSSQVLVVVYESPCNDSFAVVWSRLYNGSRVRCGGVAVGDIDGDSLPDFGFCDGFYFRLFRCTGNDQYEQFWQAVADEPGENPPVAIYDINADGKNELLYRLGQTTVIRQYVSLGVEELRQRRLQQVVVYPSAVAGGKGIRVSGLGSGAKVEVVDACGRVVAIFGSRTGEAVWHTGSVRPGAYFIRASLGAQSVTRKVIVLR